MSEPDPDETEAVNRFRQNETRKADRAFFRKLGRPRAELDDESDLDRWMIWRGVNRAARGHDNLRT